MAQVHNVDATSSPIGKIMCAVVMCGVMVGRVAPLMFDCLQYSAVVHQFRYVLGCTARQIHVGMWSNTPQLELYTTGQ